MRAHIAWVESKIEDDSSSLVPFRVDSPTRVERTVQSFLKPFSFVCDSQQQS
jgi:hypothetical protein